MPGKNRLSHEDSSHQSTLRRSPRFLLLSRIDGRQPNSKENQVRFSRVSSVDKSTHPTEIISPKKSRNRKLPLRVINSTNGSRKPSASIGSCNASPGFSSRRGARKYATEKTQFENLGFSEKRIVSEVSSKGVCKNDRRRSLRLMGFRVGVVDLGNSSGGKVSKEMSQIGECREERRRSLRFVHRGKDGERSHDFAEKRVSLKETKKGDGRNERRRSLRLMEAGKGLSRTIGSLKEKISREVTESGDEHNERSLSLRLMGYKKQKEFLSNFSNKENPSKRNQKRKIQMERRHSVGLTDLAESVGSFFSIKHHQSPRLAESVGSLGNIHNFWKERVSSEQSSLGSIDKAGKKAMMGENVTATVATSPRQVTKKKRVKSESRSDSDGIIKRGDEEVQGLHGWTEDQETALQRAYFAAKPSPQFWKKVAKLVPGKSAQDCFDRIHANLATPQLQTRSRLHKSNSSPLGHYTLSGGKLLENIDPNVKIPKRSKQKNLAVQKMVRKMLQKHHIADKSYEADLFSVLEAAADVPTQDLSQATVPSTPDCVLKSPGFLQKCQRQSSPAHRKTLLKLKIVSSADLTSPPVLKQVKNMALHEKYIDQLHSRESRRKRAASAQVKGSKMGRGKLEKDVKSARIALVSDAIDVIRQFKEMQSVDMGDYQYVGDEDDGDDNDDDNYKDGPCQMCN